MKPDDRTVDTSTTPAGAVFRRCALQVNPASYKKTFRGQQIDGDTGSHARAIVRKAFETGISALAITNHNDVSDVSVFRDAAEDHGITIFPGFELTSSEGIHVLCIYPKDTSEEELAWLLGDFGIHRTTPSTDLSREHFKTILAKVRQRGGISIAAHATNDKGLFKTLSGQARIKAWRCADLLAIQIPGAVEDLPPDIRSIVENKNPDYRRAHPADENLALAVINAKDVIDPEDLDHRSTTCWIKMSDISINGLRQAFLDPGSRIRLNRRKSDPEPEEHTQLVELAWDGGLLDGQVIRWNPNLNVLLGGRGAGKSTVVESLRYVLGLDPAGDDALKAHQGIVRQVLKDGTKVSLRARSYRPAEREYLIERIVANPPVVRDQDGQVLDLMPTDVLPRVEVYGQHEISELTRSPEKLTRLLYRFGEYPESLTLRRADLIRDLEKTRRSILDVREEIEQMDDRLATLPGLEETLKRFREAGLEERLHQRSLLVREESILDSIPQRLMEIRECIETLGQELPIDLLFLSPKALEGLPGNETIADARQVLEYLNQRLEQGVNLLGEAIRHADQGIDDIRDRWDEHRREIESNYHKILRELQKSDIEGEQFIHLRRRIENLRSLGERKSSFRRLESEQMHRRHLLLKEWEDLKAEEFKVLQQAATKVNKELQGHVQVEVTAEGDRDPLFRLLRDKVGGRLSEAIEQLAEVNYLFLRDFVDSCRSGPDDLESMYSVPPNQAARLAGASDETLMLVEELHLEPTTEVRLNTATLAEPPSWQALDDLSTGQKATALLLLLLLESDAPLIIDQPEDDLDNRFITQSVVPRVREEKQRRQFVFSTHNANIPVLGDAELIIGLTSHGSKTQIVPQDIGSIDDRTVREMIENLLEGGQAAFETRRRKYGF